MSAKSILFTSSSPFPIPPNCGPGRQETTTVIHKNGRTYTLTARDMITVEDPYLVLVHAEAFAIKAGEPFNGQVPSRAVRDALIKSSVQI
jgi:hypothetical protein